MEIIYNESLSLFFFFYLAYHLLLIRLLISLFLSLVWNSISQSSLLFSFLEDILTLLLSRVSRVWLCATP